MKKPSAVFLLFLFVTVNTPIGQIFRLPTFLHHYSEHKNSENSTLLEFFVNHYAKTINHPDDKHQDHKNLPLRSTDFQASQIVAVAEKPTFSLPNIPNEVFEHQRTSYISQSYSNTYLENIWQPPRFV